VFQVDPFTIIERVNLVVLLQMFVGGEVVDGDEVVIHEEESECADSNNAQNATENHNTVVRHKVPSRG
jgi:hypothetical protein